MVSGTDLQCSILHIIRRPLLASSVWEQVLSLFVIEMSVVGCSKPYQYYNFPRVFGLGSAHACRFLGWAAASHAHLRCLWAVMLPVPAGIGLGCLQVFILISPGFFGPGAAHACRFLGWAAGFHAIADAPTGFGASLPLVVHIYDGFGAEVLPMPAGFWVWLPVSCSFPREVFGQSAAHACRYFD